MRLKLKRKGLYHSSSDLHYYITKTINSIRKRILGQKSPVRISIEKGFVLICGGSNPSSSSFLRCFQVSEANGSWNHLSSRHQGVSCFFAAVQFSCFFVQQKCSISKWLACFGSQSSKVTLSNINLSPCHLPSDCFVGNLHQQGNNDGLRTIPMTLQQTSTFFGENSPGHGCHVPACASSIQGVLPG